MTYDSQNDENSPEKEKNRKGLKEIRKGYRPTSGGESTNPPQGVSGESSTGGESAGGGESTSPSQEDSGGSSTGGESAGGGSGGGDKES